MHAARAGTSVATCRSMNTSAMPRSTQQVRPGQACSQSRYLEWGAFKLGLLAPFTVLYELGDHCSVRKVHKCVVARLAILGRRDHHFCDLWTRRTQCQHQSAETCCSSAIVQELDKAGRTGIRAAWQQAGPINRIQATLAQQQTAAAAVDNSQDAPRHRIGERLGAWSRSSPLADRQRRPPWTAPDWWQPGRSAWALQMQCSAASHPSCVQHQSISGQAWGQQMCCAAHSNEGFSNVHMVT